MEGWERRMKEEDEESGRGRREESTLREHVEEQG